MTDAQLVSVVIPAYNASSTLDETLLSVRSQTHHALEIIVVNDGSTDDTGAIAKRHAAVDSRVQVVTQDNAGLAAARNAGWRRARSDLIAFLDADDLWAPRKIERQLHALQAAGKHVGLVYCWQARIDSQGVILNASDGPLWEGDVLDRILLGNFVGNGSSALILRQALVDANGFDSELRAFGAEGCEDWLLYCRVAERYHYAVVPEHLTGYRYLPHNMSSNRPRMLRSWLLAHNEMLARHPDHSKALQRGVRTYGGGLIRDALYNAGLRHLPPILLLLFRRYPSVALIVLLRDIPSALIEKVRAPLRRLRRRIARSTNTQAARRFLIGKPDECHGRSPKPS
jgi:glycosyltransferase involved in cell wall biosynthesis